MHLIVTERMLEERESNLVMNFNFVTLHLGIYKLVPTISQQKLDERPKRTFDVYK